MTIPQNKWQTTQGEDFLQLNLVGVPGISNPVAGIDSNGAPYGALAAPAPPSVPATQGFPQFASYTFSVTGGVVSARNNTTGLVDYSGSDAAVVINAVLAANASVGGTLYFKNGIYNLNSSTSETATNWTMFKYCIGIPANQYGSLAEWHFIGESETLPLGELDLDYTQYNGVLFSVQSGALAGKSDTDQICAFFTRPYPGVASYYLYRTSVFLQNIGVRFPSNQVTNQIAICMYAASNIDCHNVSVDFDVLNSYYPSHTPAVGTIGITSAYSGAGNWMHFTDCWATGFWIGYDLQSEHTYGDTMTSEYCTYAGYIGRGQSFGASVPPIYHTSYQVHTIDQECKYGWVLGGNLEQGSQVTFINYTIEEYITGGTPFTRVAHMSETHPGYSSGLITWSNVTTPGGAYGTRPLFASGSGGYNIVQQCGNIGNASGLNIIGPTPTAASGMIGSGNIGLGSTTAATATGGSATLPDKPVGFLEVNIGGTMYKVPYYAA